jgi:hypothetical protein
MASSTTPAPSWATIAAAVPTPAKEKLKVVLSHYPTPKSNYEQFTFFVRSAAEEFLNDIKQGSYALLNNKWWKSEHEKILRMVDACQLNNYGISAKFIESLLAALPADLLDKKQTEAFTKYIMSAYVRYNGAVKKTCYCDDALCMGDCGVLNCGCIDCCRCWRDNDRWR